MTKYFHAIGDHITVCRGGISDPIRIVKRYDEKARIIDFSGIQNHECLVKFKDGNRLTIKESNVENPLTKKRSQKWKQRESEVISMDNVIETATNEMKKIQEAGIALGHDSENRSHHMDDTANWEDTPRVGTILCNMLKSIPHKMARSELRDFHWRICRATDKYRAAGGEDSTKTIFSIKKFIIVKRRS